MRERKLRSTAESLERLRRSLIPYTYYIYKIKRKVKSKNTMRICSLSVPRLKDEWNQTVWSVNNLRCGTAVAAYRGRERGEFCNASRHANEARSVNAVCATCPVIGA